MSEASEPWFSWVRRVFSSQSVPDNIATPGGEALVPSFIAYLISSALGQDPEVRSFVKARQLARWCNLGFDVRL
jgi:hypothetical protein